MLISKFSNGGVEEKIIEMERKYAINLPIDYRAFLCKYNGGYTPKTKFRAEKISSDIRGFFGIGDVKLSLDKFVLNEWVERGILPIACDSFGNYIVIDLSNDYGKTYFCDHEKGNKLEAIGKDLKSFVGCCKSEKINVASRRSIKEREVALISKGRENTITD